MAGVITTGNHPKLLWPGIKALFGNTYDELPKEYTELFEIMSSSRAYEEMVETTGFGLVPVKDESSSSDYDSHTQGAVSRFAHIAYSLGYIVTREEQADNMYEQVSRQRATALAFSANQTRENVGAQIYNRAFSSSYLGADGVQLIASTHPATPGSGGNQSNVLSTAADFNEASLEDLTIQLMNAKNSRGLRISLKPTTLIGPVNLVYEFERVLKSALQNDTANNAINAVRSTGAVPRAIVSHYLTDTDAWFIKTNAPNGLIWFDREPISFNRDTDFDTDNAKAKLYMRFSAGWSDWRALFGTPGA
jgi:hypothetical protein